MKKYLLLIPIFFLLTSRVFGNSIITGPTPTKKLIGPNPPAINFYLTTTPRINVISGGVSGQVTILDVVYDEITGAVFDNEFDVHVSSVVSGPTLNNIQYTSVTPDIATVGSGGRITRVSDGIAKINVKTTPISGKYLTKQISYPVSRESGDVQTFNSFESGSLARHIYDDIDSRIDGVVASDTTTKLFSTQDYESSTYVWNTDFWAYGVDFTPVVAGTSFTDCCPPGDFERRGGVLISPRHVLFANHYTIPTGQTVRFVKQDGTVVTRTISNQAQVGTTDIQIALLDSDVDSGIGFAKVMPSNFESYLPSLVFGSDITIPSVNLMGGAYFLGNDSDKRGYIREVIDQDFFSSVVYGNPIIPERAAFFGRTYQNGDSGNPNFVIINDELVVLNAVLSPGGSGPFISKYITEINSVMTSLGGGYELEEVDLSSFNTY